MKRVVIAGATGLVGNELLTLLLEDQNIAEVVALIRRPLAFTHTKLIQIQTDFDDLETFRRHIYGHCFYCCIGTTKRKTPNREDYYRIDHDYPVSLAKIASENNMEQFHFISALGANKNSNIFYNRIKGEVESDIEKLKFESVFIYQPSLIVGTRTERRLLEKVAIRMLTAIEPLLIGDLKKYRSIKANTIAQAMIKQTFKKNEGVIIYSSEEIKNLV